MKKVSIITNIPAPYRVDFFKYMKNHIKDYDISIIYTGLTAGNRKWKVDIEDVENDIVLKSKCIEIKKRYNSRYIYIPLNITKTLKKVNSDIIIASEYNPTAVIACLWCKKNNKKFISWTDGTKTSEKKLNFIQKITRKYIISHADAFIASSSKSKELQIKYGADESKCYISYLTVNIDKYMLERNYQSQNRLLCVASLIRRKGIDLLLNALAKVKCNFELNIAGDGLEKKALQQQARKYGLQDKVHFLGYIENMKEVYKSNDIFILPTREDCYALVILEAMCAGMPVIVSKYADGHHDMVVDGFNGKIIDPYDENDFSKQIDNLLSSTDLQKKYGLNNKKILNKFKFEETIKGFYDAIKSVQ